MVPKILSILQSFTLLYLFTVTFASTEEANALLKLKATLQNQNNSLLASWTLSSNACRDWYGVKCFKGRVNTLNITNASVIGRLYYFPFSSLHFLKYLEGLIPQSPCLKQKREEEKKGNIMRVMGSI